MRSRGSPQDIRSWHGSPWAGGGSWLSSSACCNIILQHLSWDDQYSSPGGQRDNKIRTRKDENLSLPGLAWRAGKELNSLALLVSAVARANRREAEREFQFRTKSRGRPRNASKVDGTHLEFSAAFGPNNSVNKYLCRNIQCIGPLNKVSCVGSEGVRNN